MRHLNKLQAVILLIFALPALAQTPSQADLQNDLNQRLSGIKSLQADFTQTTIDASHRTLQQASGKLWVARPSKFRIETRQPSVQTLVSNGVDFWTWDADLEQVIVKKLEKDIKQVPILLLGGDTRKITRAYTISRYNRDGDERFVLTASSTSSLFETLAITFHKGIPESISITDSLGQQTRIQLSHVVINQAISDTRFEFTPPKGADVIDDRGAH